MTLGSVLLVVLASILHASWNLLAKRAAAAGPVFVFAYTLIACVAYAPWAMYLLATSTLAWTGEGLLFIGLSGLIHLAYSLCLQQGYRVADLSVVYPVARGTGPMLSTVGALLILGEAPSLGAVAGLLLVVAGIGLIATRGDLAAFRQPGAQSGVRWGTATGGLIALYTVVDAYAVKMVGLGPVLLDWFANLVRVIMLAPLVLKNPRAAMKPMRGHWWTAIGVGLLASLGYILVLTALAGGAPLHVVAPMREMSMMIGVLMGMFVLKETVGVWRLGGCAVLIAGVILLTAS